MSINVEESERNAFRMKMKVEKAKQSGETQEGSSQADDSINPYIPKYMAQTPWYADQTGDSLGHQRKDGGVKVYDGIDKHYDHGKFIGQATKYRKGACKNCGSMTHKEKDCFYPPRRRGAWKTNKDIKPDEFINKELNLSYEGKRDRWNGAEADQVVKRQQMLMNEVEENVKRQRMEEAMSKFETEPDGDHKKYWNSIVTKEKVEREKLVDDGAIEDVHISDSEEDSSDVEQDVERITKPEQITSAATNIVQNMRIREDIAEYLKDLNDDSYATNAYKVGNGGADEDFGGKSFVRASGEVNDFKEAQLFAWEAHTKGASIHMQAQPTATALLQKEVKERKKQLEEIRKKKLEKRYGVKLGEQAQIPIVQVTENYVEYDRSGKVIRGLEEAVPSSRYNEDIFPGNHKSIWGSWFDRANKKWGYACCHQCTRNAYCIGEKGLVKE